VYTFVANMVEERLEEAAANGEPRAMLLKGNIARKVVKQTVMTTVYGVTFVGARDQIRKQLVTLPGLVHNEEESYRLAVYAAKVTLDRIGDLFTGAKAIQAWLNQIAGLISKSIPPERIDLLLRGQGGGSARGKHADGAVKRNFTAIQKEQMTSMIWTTPLGMPVVQPYRKQAKKQIFTALQTVFIADPNLPMEVSPRKQASAFPPNFIHSLDATHMMLTALSCRDKQLTFASVHDSYWTHAASIDDMSASIRETFVKLHSADILGNLLVEIKQRYKDYKVPVQVLKRSKPRTKSERKLAEEEAEESADAKVPAGFQAVPAEDMENLAGSPEIDIEVDGSELARADVEEDEHDVGAETEDEKPRRRKRTTKMNDTETIPTRFVNLVDILPPLPSKGMFDIAKIKDSLYFFS